ncbi:unnamed protein product [Calypogeia fissa]
MGSWGRDKEEYSGSAKECVWKGEPGCDGLGENLRLGSRGSGDCVFEYGEGRMMCAWEEFKVKECILGHLRTKVQWDGARVVMDGLGDGLGGTVLSVFFLEELGSGRTAGGWGRMGEVVRKGKKGEIDGSCSVAVNEH